MKFSLTGAIAALALSTATSAYILPRQDAGDQQQQDQQQQDQSALSQYPEYDFGSLNGTWFLTGITDNAWKTYQTLTQAMGFDINCLQFNLTSSSNSTLDVVASAFLNKTSADVGVNATAAGALILKAPDSSTNTSDHQYDWDAYGSQVFVNKGQWENFTSNGQNTESSQDNTSTTITGTKPFQLTLYSKLIDSGAQPGSNDSTNFDTIFLWGSQIQFIDNNQNQNQKRADEVYGVLLSKTSSIEDDKFNNTVALLPQALAANNVSLVKMNDTCNAESSA